MMKAVPPRAPAETGAALKAIPRPTTAEAQRRYDALVAVLVANEPTGLSDAETLAVCAAFGKDLATLFAEVEARRSRR